MADAADIASDVQDIEKARMLEALKPVAIPAGAGECWLEHCDEVPANGGRWCCPEHRDLWEREGGKPKTQKGPPPTKGDGPE